MEDIPTFLTVVALALFDSEGRILLQQRPAGKHHAGLWEFPGGKVEAGEFPRDALVREIEEELAIALDPQTLSPCHFAEDYGHTPIVLLLYTSRQAGVRPRGMDGQAWRWSLPAEAAALPLAPMDRALLNLLSDKAA
ncbi:NUDIX domain-containing protein [Erythrobacter arachoides]|uniref:8-oxo-dGTP diphosphatase n=1 Tax=Aurantiacibacter arachoides TaxID=1850444 RepID=A0A844ZXX4_9SPHN|nr:NUDIX domain-containing protein [Aurantiacibacter arachoides]